MSQLYHGNVQAYSDVNATTTPLGAGETFTGGWEDGKGFADIVVAVATDQDGSYQVQFSPDGVNADFSLTRYYRTNTTNSAHRFTLTRKFFRIAYTNTSSSPQSYMRLQAAFGHRHALNLPIDAVVSQDYDATMVRVTDYRYEVAKSLREGHFTYNKFGYNADVDTAEETVWTTGGLYVPPTTASTLTVVSASTADDGDPEGTGAHSIRVTGLDANRKVQTEDITLDGTSNVVTTSTWLGINRAQVLSSGSGQTNAGLISITATTGGATLAQLPAGQSVTQQLIYHVQSQAQAMLDWGWFSCVKIGVGNTPLITIKGWVFDPARNTKYEILRFNVDTAIENTIELHPSQPWRLGPGSVLQITAQSDVINAEVTGRFSLIEIQDANYDPNSDGT